MTRFDILAILAGQNRGITCREIAELSGQTLFGTRSFRASLNSRLRRLWRWGLVRREMRQELRPRHARTGVYVWDLSARGRQRLAWAQGRGIR